MTPPICPVAWAGAPANKPAQRAASENSGRSWIVSIMKVSRFYRRHTQPPRQSRRGQLEPYPPRDDVNQAEPGRSLINKQKGTASGALSF